jgi:hypothetical protein
VLGTPHIEIFLSNEKELSKLKLSASIDELKYNPETKQKDVTVTLSLSYDGDSYEYGGLTLVGVADVKKTISYNFDSTKGIAKTLETISKTGQEQLEEIKKEVFDLLCFGQKVKVDLNGMLARIVGALGGWQY